jgi:4'-phosphopantetheinyl transferase EntD
LPRWVATAETRGDLLNIELFEEEKRAPGRAVEKRRREFVSGRACARLAMGQLGIAPTAVPNGERGEPQWPDGITGSITHCPGYRASAVTKRTWVSSLGIDAEVNAPLPDGVFEAVAFDRERELREEVHGVWLDRLLFSAKEAIYKAWYPCAKRWLGFEEVDLSIDLSETTFCARLLVPGPLVDGVELTEIRGRWCAEAGLICTAAIVPRLV